MLGCGEKEYANCDFVDICRDGDAFQCNDDLFYAVHPEYGLQYVAETTEELQAYCCPDGFCDSDGEDQSNPNEGNDGNEGNEGGDPGGNECGGNEGGDPGGDPGGNEGGGNNGSNNGGNNGGGN